MPLSLSPSLPSLALSPSHFPSLSILSSLSLSLSLSFFLSLSVPPSLSLSASGSLAIPRGHGDEATARALGRHRSAPQPKAAGSLPRQPSSAAAERPRDLRARTEGTRLEVNLICSSATGAAPNTSRTHTHPNPQPRALHAPAASRTTPAAAAQRATEFMRSVELRRPQGGEIIVHRRLVNNFFHLRPGRMEKLDEGAIVRQVWA